MLPVDGKWSIRYFNIEFTPENFDALTLVKALKSISRIYFRSLEGIFVPNSLLIWDYYLWRNGAYLTLQTDRQNLFSVLYFIHGDIFLKKYA